MDEKKKRRKKSGLPHDVDGRASNGHTRETMLSMYEKARKGKSEQELTHQAQLFVYNYILTWSPRKAAEAAGYSKTNAAQAGWHLLRDPRVIKLLDEERAAIKTDYRRTHEALTAFYLRVLETDLTEVLENLQENVATDSTIALPDGQGVMLSSISINDTKHGQNMSFKVFSKEAAADMLNKHVGYYEKDNNQKPVSGVAIYLPDNGRGDTTEE